MKQLARKWAIFVRTSISEFSISSVIKLVFSIIIYLRPDGCSLIYWDRENSNSLKLDDFNQKPNVSFWHSFTIYLELFWGKIISLAKNLEKLTEARHF
jgi:hypothetical protein